MSKLLVVVDYQKDFVDGALGFPGAEKLDEGILTRIKEYRDAGEYVLVTRDTHGPNYLNTREGKALPVEHCFLGTEGHDLYGKTGEYLDELLKKHFSREYRLTPGLAFVNKVTFGVSPEYLVGYKTMVGVDFDEIEFVGLVSNICVISNVICFQAAFPSAQMIVDSALTASFDADLHQKTLDVLRGLQVIVK